MTIEYAECYVIFVCENMVFALILYQSYKIFRHCRYIFARENQFFCNELLTEQLPFFARFAVHSSLVKKCGQRMWEEYGEQGHTWNEREMEKAWEKMDRVEKAGKGRSERGNGGMMVDRYLNN